MNWLSSHWAFFLPLLSLVFFAALGTWLDWRKLQTFDFQREPSYRAYVLSILRRRRWA